MNKKRAYHILNLLKKYYPHARIALKYSNNFELLVSVILSAQTTDLQVNKITSSLFPKYRGNSKTELEEIKNFANVNLNELENDLKSVGLYRNKAKNIKETARLLIEKFDGVIPNSINDLLKLPGVGRKTANVVLANAYGKIGGIAVDTHVKRLSIKYGFTQNQNPEKIEKDLMKLFNKEDWIKVTDLLIAHGKALRKRKVDFISLPE